MYFNTIVIHFLAIKERLTVEVFLKGGVGNTVERKQERQAIIRLAKED